MFLLVALVIIELMSVRFYQDCLVVAVNRLKLRRLSCSFSTNWEIEPYSYLKITFCIEISLIDDRNRWFFSFGFVQIGYHNFEVCHKCLCKNTCHPMQICL